AILGNLDQALADCDQALKINPKFTNTMFKSGPVSARQHRGFVHLKAGRHAEAIEDYNLAVEIKSNAETLYGRGLAKQKTSDAAGAASDIAAAKTLDPQIVEKFSRFGIK